MTQCCSHLPDTLVYRERYLQTFHRTKNSVLRFCTSKATGAEANRQNWDLRELMVNQHANEARQNAAAKGVGWWIKRGLKGPITGWIGLITEPLQLHQDTLLELFCLPCTAFWAHIDVFYRDRQTSISEAD